MRAVYALITFFLLLCVFFTRWYLCEVRGLCELVAILEVLMMILAAFVIGFAGSWLLSESTFRLVREQLGRLQREGNGLRGQLFLLEKENHTSRKQLADWQQEALLLAQRNKSSEPLVAEAQRQVSTLEQELEQYRKRYDNLKVETDEMRNAAVRLRTELADERSRLAKQMIETANAKEEKPEEKKKPETLASLRSRFTPSTWQTKNDLTLISGIGPVIQKKLNEIGIYSFKQISELTPESVDLITKAIKFFPDRIGRDNWIGQAAALSRMKK